MCCFINIFLCETNFRHSGEKCNDHYYSLALLLKVMHACTVVFVPSVQMSAEGNKMDGASFDLTDPVGATGDHIGRISRDINGYKVIKR